MKLEGKLFHSNLLIGDRSVELDEFGDGSLDKPGNFSRLLGKGLVMLCHELEIPIPIWMDKNTHEFARFRQTIFFAEHFTEKVYFDRFQIKLHK
ncbi:MAG: hypothetical protein ACYCYI_07660 [Saccharofermentanales bacterium]